jgi:3'-phosphoadenosine 5'-phosphosulfate sulfotransferase (PAPS reductase)/FAD synthetase
MTNETNHPDLTTYDYIVISTSAGKDSQAMLDYVMELAETAGVTDRVIAVHADLGRAEWPGVGELAKEQADHYNVPLRVVKRPQGDLLDQIEARGMFPGPSTRYCTSDQKRGQIDKVYTALSREAGRYVNILCCIGLRAQESNARSKATPFKNDKRNSNGKRNVDTWLPIHTWTEDEVWTRIEQSGVRHHQAYDLGMPRLSCMFCIFAPKSALKLAGKANPEALEEWASLEDRIGHTITTEISLRQIADELKTDDQVGDVADWTM